MNKAIEKAKKMGKDYIAIVRAEDERLEFSNGLVMWSDFLLNCCEYNYAAFGAIDDAAWNAVFTLPLTFEKCEYGFRFGNQNNMHFVPCYSTQSGVYGADIDIFFDGDQVLSRVDSELI